MKRRSTLRKLICGSLTGLLVAPRVYSKTFLTPSQAQRALWGGTSMRKIDVTLTGVQARSIQSASGVRVLSKKLNVYKTHGGGWFILDQVIGKHENIDYAVALTSSGEVKGIEVLVYRESYGHEIMNPKWKAQFYGRGAGTKLKLDREIKNISGATLSCAHITDGINRLIETWSQVLRHL